MKKRISGMVILLLLVAIIWHEGQAWRSFQWAVFWRQAAHANAVLVLLATALIYAAFVLRAFRWKLLMKPLHETTVTRVLGPTLIGFTALALLGRAGEFVRPYLLARREGVSVSSQIALWMIERVFDTAAFTVLLIAALLLSPSLRALPHMDLLRQAFLVILAILAGGIVAGLVLARKRHAVANFVRRLLTSVSPRLAGHADNAVRGAGEAVLTVGPRAGLEVAAVSIIMWFVVALSYWSVVRALPPLAQMSLAQVILLMSFSLAGSLAQLPGGGAAQLAVVAALVSVFSVAPDVAVSCGILLWLATYMAPVPAGLALLRGYGLSLRNLSTESRRQQSGNAAVSPSQPAST